MSAATKAVKDFIKTYSGRFDENGQETTIADLNLGRWVCLVWFNKKGGVTGGGDWVDVSNKSGYQMATDTSGWSAHDGTNLDCGLRLADYQLKQNTVAKISKNLKNVIVLSDGEPTFYLSKGVSIKGSIKIGNTKYYVHGSGKDCKKDTYNTTKSTAATLRNSASVYTVCFGASGNEIKDYDKNGNQKITVGNYLKQKIATQPKSGSNEKFAYDAADADALNTAFAAISKTIVSGLSTGTVKDTLPTGISSTVFGEGKTVMNWELNSDAFNKTEETKPLADGTKETVYTYTKTYTVTIDPDNENLVKTEDGYAPLNGKTTLTVKNSKGENVEIPFPIPAGKVTMPSYTVTGTIDNNGAVTGSGQTVNAGESSTAMVFTPAAGYEIKTITEKIGDGQPATITVTDKNSYTYPAKDNVKADIKVTVTTQKRTDLSYTIKYIEKGTTNEIMASTTVDNQEFGAEIVTSTITAPEIAGFGYDSCTPNTLTIGADVNQNVITLYYTRNKYKVTYTYTGSVPQGLQPPTETEYDFGASVTIANAPDAVPGYTFEGWKRGTEDATNFSMPAENVTITGNWKKNDDAGYKIEYYLETLTEGTFEKDNNRTISDRTGTIGTTASVTDADKVTIPGFTFDANNTNNKLEGEIVSGDPLTLKLYYKRNSYKVTYQYTGTVPTGASTLPPEATYKYGAEVTVAKNATAPDHDFSGWRTTDASINNGKFVMPAKNVTITGSWTQATYDVDLSPYVKKTLEVDGTLPTDFSETFKVDVTVDGQRLQQQGTVTMTATGTSNFTMPTVALTEGTHTIMVQEVVDEQTKNSNIAYDTNQKTFVLNILTSDAATTVQYGTTNSDGKFVKEKELAFVTITNTYIEEKDPNECTIDFSKFVKKELTATGSKTVDEATFIVDVAGSYDGEDIANALTPTETQATTDEDVLNTTLTATIKNIVGGNVYEEPFTGSVTVSKPGHYTFTLTERKGTQSGVTYDESTYQVSVDIGRIGNNLVICEAKTYLNNEPVELIKLENDAPVTAGYIIFKNTIDTGRDDYIPIIIPTIINKDTGMLNKTDHFAYVIGYPDGTVHPNGQITRAEVATIFFRLLRDEVRDGAFTTSNTYSDVAYGKWYNNPISTMSALGIITGYPDGTFKPNKPITRAEFAAIAARFDETQSGKSATFSDVIGHWAAKEIGIAYYNDWIKGYPDGTFKPDQNITRAEAMTLINRVLERKPESPADLLTNMNKWTDNMDTSKWYYLDVQEATNSHGYTRKTFNYELWRQMLPDPDWSRYER